MKKIFVLLILTNVLITSCIEPFDFQAEDFESALVVEANITNELKPQTVLLSRTFEIDTDGPNPEQNATVRVEDLQGNTFNFIETTPGTYLSSTAFAATQNNTYTLFITLANGASYTSTPQTTPPVSEIENLVAQRGGNPDGIDGVSILVSSATNSSDALFYSYKYEETYKVIAPEWRNTSLVVTDPVFPACSVEFVDRSTDVMTCFPTDVSTTINQISTGTTGSVQQFLVRFINSNNPIISHRYSINVKQFVQNSEAFAYFQTLSDFAGEGNLFSQIQVGFINGNIIANNNPEEKTIGFFEVTTVSEERLFFNYQDFFQGEPLPPYFVSCNVFAPAQFTMGMPPNCGELINRTIADEIIYVDDNNGQLDGGPFLMALKVCGDCTTLGPSEAPDFWIE